MQSEGKNKNVIFSFRFHQEAYLKDKSVFDIFLVSVGIEKLTFFKLASLFVYKLLRETFTFQFKVIKCF